MPASTHRRRCSSSATALSPPAGAYSAATGSIGVKVLDSNQQPVAGVSVSVTGTSAQSQNTTTEGCACLPLKGSNTPHNSTTSSYSSAYPNRMVQLALLLAHRLHVVASDFSGRILLIFHNVGHGYRKSDVTAT